MTGERQGRSRSPPIDPMAETSSSQGIEPTRGQPLLNGHCNIDHKIQISVHKLNVKNYIPWSQAMKLMIRGRGRLGYLTRLVKTPQKDDPAYQKWDAENSTIMAWLINSMEEEIGQLFLFLPVAKDIWYMAKETYSDMGNSAQISELKSRLRETKHDSMSVTQYYSTLAQLWKELDLFVETDWSCTQDNVKYTKMLEKERVFEFLARLNKELDEVRGRVLGKEPLPYIREVFAEVRRKESRRKVMMGESTSISNL